MLRLSELAARCVAMHIPFEMVEKFQPPVPEELQQRITFWSFPEWDDEICLYTCLANSNDDEFLRGEILFENGNVYDVIQIGTYPKSLDESGAFRTRLLYVLYCS